MVNQVSSIKEVCDTNGKLTYIFEYEKDNESIGEFTLWFDCVVMESFFYYKISISKNGNYRLHKNRHNKFDYYHIGKDLFRMLSHEQQEYLKRNAVKNYGEML